MPHFADVREGLNEFADSDDDDEDKDQGIFHFVLRIVDGFCQVLFEAHFYDDKADVFTNINGSISNAVSTNAIWREGESLPWFQPAANL